MNRHVNVYGIDMPSRNELVAYGRDTPSIAREIGADLVIFQTLSDLIESVRHLNPNIQTFDCSVFTGEYVTGGVDDAYLAYLESLRADNIKNNGVSGSLGVLEGKGGGAKAWVNGDSKHGSPILPPTNGSDTVGLHNSWNITS